VSSLPGTGLAARLRAATASRLARDTLTVFLFSGLGRALALGKEMLVAALFGVGGQLDAYVLAFLIPSLLVNIFGAAFASALVPALGRAAATKTPGGQTDANASPDPSAAPRLLLAGLSAQAGLILAAALAMLCVPAPALRALAPFLAPERLLLVKTMQTDLLPLFVLASLSQTMAACVNYRGGFRGPASASTLGALTAIAVIAAAHGDLGLSALVAGVDAGAAVEFCLLAWMLRRAWAAPRGDMRRKIAESAEPSGVAGSAANGVSQNAADTIASGFTTVAPDLLASQPSGQQSGPDSPYDAPSHTSLRAQSSASRGQTPRPAVPHPRRALLGTLLGALLGDWSMLALGAGTLALSAFIDNAIASTLGEGAVSALSYAWKLPSGFAALLGLTLSTVLLPYFTSLANNAPAAELARSCRRVVTRLLSVCAPLAAAGALASPLLVALLFQRGRFDAQAAGLVSAVQACYFIQLPFYLLCIVTQRMLQALSRFRFLFALQAGLVAVNALTCYALSRVFGVAGIALSSTCMYALTAGISLVALRRGLRARAAKGAAANGAAI